jgi:DNA-binding GntR family transcriptional regulator
VTKFAQRRAEDLITAGLRSGLINETSKLAERDLVESLATSRSAVRSALSALSSQGIFRRSPRSGTVPDGYWQQRDVAQLTLADDLNGALRYDVLDIRTARAPHLVRSEFGLAEGAEASVVEFLRRAGRTRVSVFTNYLPVLAGCDPIVRSRELQQQLLVLEFKIAENEVVAPTGPAIGRISQSFGASRCDEETAQLLMVEPGSPLLWEQIMIRGQDEEPLMLTFARHNPYHIGLRYEQRYAG